MTERTSPPLGAYRVRAHARPAPDKGGWVGCGQTWTARDGGPLVLLAEVEAGPCEGEQAAVDLAYDRAYTDTLRLILREFACF